MAYEYIWYTDKLKGEYKETFDKVEIYASVRNIDADTQNDMLMELIDMFLMAQEEGKPVQKIIGSDIESFCNSFFGSYTFKSYLRNFPKKLYRLLWFVFAFEMICLFMSEEEVSLLHDSVDVAGYLCGIAVGVVIGLLCNILIRPFIFRWKWLTSGRFSAMILILSFSMTIAAIILLEDYTFELPLFPLLLVSGIYIPVYITVRSIWRFTKYGSIRKQKSEGEKEGFSSILKETAEKMPEDLVKRYHKKNKRRQKKGKAPMTPEEYMELLRRQNIRARRGDCIGLVLVLLVIVEQIIQTALTSTITDALIFSVVLVVAEIPAMYLFRVGRKATEAREQLIEECDSRGITVLEYVEEKSKN